MNPAEAHAAGELADLVRQTMVAGASRRAALLHMDQMPSALARPHHQRLARNALANLAGRDHAQSVELSRGRLAIVWRSRGPDDIAGAMAGLEHLLADLPSGQAIPMGQILSVFDLPSQAPWLLDTLAEPPPQALPSSGPDQGLDPMLLARLEENLIQADLSQFLRWRPVHAIDGAAPALAWDDRFISSADLAECLCPGRTLDEAGWLFRRLSRSIDRRLLTLLTGPRELSGCRPFSLTLNVGSILSPAFVAFDAALPAGLRGKIVLKLDEADVLSDAAQYSFARSFAHTRFYKLLLRNAAPHPDSALLDAEAAGVDFVEMRLTPALMANAAALPDRSRLVLTGLDRLPQFAWARAQGCRFARGMALQP